MKFTYTVFSTTFFCVFLVYLCLLFQYGSSQLLINVKNQGGDVLQETIISNITEDVVTLEFQRSDGTLVTQLIDFRKNVQILKALVLGEEERGQSQYQVMCFISYIEKSEFISSDAMAKLRQKNPGTVRMPEEDRGRHNFTMDLFIDVSRSSVISKHIPNMCTEAKDATYTRRADLKLWSQQPGSSMTALLSCVTPSPPENVSPPRCIDITSMWNPCMCHLEMCIGWYPCSLKYCKGKSDASYRCGIKTCRKCNLFAYFVRQKQMCLWDE